MLRQRLKWDHIYLKKFGASWCTSRNCVLAGAFCDCDGCNHGECKRNEILYADDLLLISESIENLKRKFLKYKTAFESKGLKVYLKKTKVMASDLKEEILKSKVYPGTK